MRLPFILIIIFSAPTFKFDISLRIQVIMYELGDWED
jgi:hypothetical protein